jgi:hypothetical protein
MERMTGLTKAETLELLRGKNFPVPPLVYFTAAEWDACPAAVMDRLSRFGRERVAVRSSARAEDGQGGSMAGVYLSLLDIPVWEEKAVAEAINRVRAGLDGANDQILIQEMVADVAMAGVVATRTISGGAPYYVINYDDVSGRTDTVTGGVSNSRVVYVYRGTGGDAFDSRRLLVVVELVRRCEREFGDIPLDIEFAVDAFLNPHLLQMRPICSTADWREDLSRKIESRIKHVAEFIREVMEPRHGLHGGRSMLSVMSDWNPAEMIGIIPGQLAVSLYRELITRRTWSLARGEMGYKLLPPTDLMLLVGGRPYIDIRASFNSFLPANLSKTLSERLVNAWFDRLEANPSLHDKIEFEVVNTIAEPDFPALFNERYPTLMNKAELAAYRAELAALTRQALRKDGTLTKAAGAIERLHGRQQTDLPVEKAMAAKMPAFDVIMLVSKAIECCREHGTLPFSIMARHAFIAEAILRSLARLGVLSRERMDEFKGSVHTVVSDLIRDFAAVSTGKSRKDAFFACYGHLRPGTYDILSPTYAERGNLFESIPPRHGGDDIGNRSFSPSGVEVAGMDKVLSEAELGLDGASFLSYAKSAIAGRERAKFVFTRHVSHILDLLALWGGKLSIQREDVAMLPLDDILDILYQPLPLDGARHFKRLAAVYRRERELGRSFELPHLIRSERDVYIVPQYRSAPNFITTKRVQSATVYLSARALDGDGLTGKIVCIDSADPGYDWIFTRSIVGLITCYGGANSHMAIRCAEYGLPAAIGCGEMIFAKIKASSSCLLDCGARSITTIDKTTCFQNGMPP